MTDQKSCPECGNPLKKGAPGGLCSACLIALGMRDETPFPVGGFEEDESLLPFEDTPDRYTYLGERGRGGMGRVALTLILV